MKRILILKLAAMGDVVMASTLVGALRARWPEAQITWITDRRLLPLVSRFVGVDLVRGVDAESLLAGRGLRRAVAGLAAMWTVGRGYDLALIAHADPRYDALVLGAMPRERRAFRDASHVHAPRPGRWHGAEYARMVGDDAPALLASLRWSGGAPPMRARQRQVLLAPGGARNVLRDDHLRRWPVESWVALARELHASGCQLTVIGAKSDAREAQPLLQAVPAATDAVGKDSLDGLVERLARADAVVTHDSGILHLAQLTATPTVALFGPTRAAERVAPGARVTVLTAAASLPCAPCYDGRDYAPCARNRCLTDVPAEQVAAAVTAMLAAHAD